MIDVPERYRGQTNEQAPTIKVLDHGHVRLIEHMGNDTSIVRNARVSYDAPPRLDGSDEKLIHYLVKNRHTSPFEAVQFTFDIKCPIFVARQWHRHRTWAYNEVSARYAELPAEFYVPAVEAITTQGTGNKQMRTTEQHAEAETLQTIISISCHNAFLIYNRMLEMGCPRELARGVLPLNTYTHYFGTVDLHNLFHFLRLRLHEHAQMEIRVYAEAMLELITPIVPVAVAAFKETYDYSSQPST
jgi:thymidylate synthase (FAD)